MKTIIYLGLFGCAWFSASLAYAVTCEECKQNCRNTAPEAVNSCITNECLSRNGPC